MSVAVLAILVANVLMVGVGVGALALTGRVTTRTGLLPELGVAYLLGVVVTGVTSWYLALVTSAAGVDLGFGAVGLFVLAVASVALAWRRLAPGGRLARPDAHGLVGLAALAVAGIVVVWMVRAFALHPLREWDGWVIWGAKARALYEFGRVYEPFFAGRPYELLNLEYPLLLPALEAVDLRLMGGWNGEAIHVQSALLVAGFAGALWALARDLAWPPLVGVAVLAVACSPEVAYQLATHLMDVPLALFVACGVVALAAWLERGDGPTLAVAAVLLGGAGLMKDEGSLFAFAAVAAAAVFARRRRPLLVAAAAMLAMQVPWRLYTAAHDLQNRTTSVRRMVDPRYLADHLDRVRPSLTELLERFGDLAHWGYLVPLALAGLAAGVVLGRVAVAGFALLWFALSFVGLLLIYWTANFPLGANLFESAHRTVASLIVGGAALAPLLVGRVHAR